MSCESSTPLAALFLVTTYLCQTLAVYIAFALRLDPINLAPYQETILIYAAITVFVSSFVFVYFSMYRGIWRYASIPDVLRILKAATIAIPLIVLAVFVLLRLENVPRSVPFIQWFLTIGLLAGPRLLYRLVKDRYLLPIKTPRRVVHAVPVLLVGSSFEAARYIHAMQADPNAPYRVLGLLDLERKRVRRMVHGIEVLNVLEELEDAVEKLAAHGERPQKLIFTDFDTNRPNQVRLAILSETAARLGLSLARLPSLRELRVGVEHLDALSSDPT